VELLVVLVFAGFIFSALRITRKQKQIIEEQKKKIEEKKFLIRFIKPSGLTLSQNNFSLLSDAWSKKINPTNVNKGSFQIDI
jgi:hypothetical protein